MRYSRRQLIALCYKALIVLFVLVGVHVAQTVWAAPVCSLPTEQAYRGPTDKSVYYVTTDCTKRAFTRPDIFFTYFESWGDVQIRSDIANIPDDALGFMPFGPRYDLQAGSLVKTTDDPRVFVILEGVKQWIGSEAVFAELGYDWSWIEDVDSRLLLNFVDGGEITRTDQHPHYTLIKYEGDSRIYRLEPLASEPSGQRASHIPTEQEFLRLGYRFDRVIILPGPNPYAGDSEDPTLAAAKRKLNNDYYIEGPLSQAEVEEKVIECVVQISEDGQCTVSYRCYEGQDCDDQKNQINTYIGRINDVFDQELDDYFAASAASSSLFSTTIVKYTVVDGQLFNRQSGPLADQYPEQVADQISHDRVWNAVKQIFPDRYWQQIEDLHIFTDQQDDELAYVSRTLTDDVRWTIGFDVVDAPPLVGGIYEGLARTIVHELAHIVTLDDAQVQQGQTIYVLTDTIADIERKREQRKLACAPNYYSTRGCHESDSYLNIFFSRYWSHIAVDDIILSTSDVDARYVPAQTSYVSAYAATRPEEDVAETFTNFVFDARPDPAITTADKKILFFYEFPELVSLRTELRDRIRSAGGGEYLSEL